MKRIARTLRSRESRGGLLRQAAFAGDAVVADVVVDFVAVRTLEAAERLTLFERVRAFTGDEFALCGRKRLKTGFAFDEPDESHASIISDFRFQIEELNATANHRGTETPKNSV